ncbi:hypothetical protein AbraIFM66950_006649 [Aspergillus brasiliensis]|nr:hypothetical protein AbraIFM66950_006649 [Aspergillus brasiliensis]
MVDISSVALVGYLAPVLVTFLLFITWLIIGTRRRRRRRRRHPYGPRYPYSDAEMAARGHHTRIIISQQLIEEMYPQARYKDWLSEKQQQHVSSGGISQVKSAGDNSPGESSPNNTNTNISDSIQARDKDMEDMNTDIGTDADADAASRDNHRICAICMDQFADDDEIRALPCGHIFHTACLDPWVTKRNAFCPLCKMSLSGVKEGGESGENRRSWVWRRASQRLSARVVVSVPEAAVIRGSF